MKPAKLSIYFDMSVPADVEKLLRINAILAGAPATGPLDQLAPPSHTFSHYVTDPAPTTEAPTVKAPAVKAPAAKAPTTKAPAAKEPTTEAPEIGFWGPNYQDVTQDLTAAIISAVGAENPKSAANGALIGAELKRLGFEKVSQMPDELKPALLEFIVKNTK